MNLKVVWYVYRAPRSRSREASSPPPIPCCATTSSPQTSGMSTYGSLNCSFAFLKLKQNLHFIHLKRGKLLHQWGACSHICTHCTVWPWVRAQFSSQEQESPSAQCARWVSLYLFLIPFSSVCQVSASLLWIIISSEFKGIVSLFILIHHQHSVSDYFLLLSAQWITISSVCLFILNHHQLRISGECLFIYS